MPEAYAWLGSCECHIFTPSKLNGHDKFNILCKHSNTLNRFFNIHVKIRLYCITETYLSEGTFFFINHRCIFCMYNELTIQCTNTEWCILLIYFYLIKLFFLYHTSFEFVCLHRLHHCSDRSFAITKSIQLPECTHLQQVVRRVRREGGGGRGLGRLEKKTIFCEPWNFGNAHLAEKARKLREIWNRDKLRKSNI